MKTHKHKGLLTSSGALRMHPVGRVHKDSKVQKWHNESLDIKISTKPTFFKTSKKSKRKDKPFVMATVDSDGYINIDLDLVKQRGIRLKFTRKEGRTKRRVGLAIDRE